MNSNMLILDDVLIEVAKKKIKNINVRVYPSGEVKISAPLRMNMNTIRSFAQSKLDWIRHQQQKFSTSRRTTSPVYVDDERHYVWGKSYVLKVIEQNSNPDVRLESGNLLLSVKRGTDREKKHAIISYWYRKQLETTIQFLYDKWKHVIGVDVEKFSIRSMKTRWGSCSPRSRRIRVNTELVKKPIECLEYVIVHEMIHILEPSHNQRFQELMGIFMPEWQFHRNKLKHSSDSD